MNRDWVTTRPADCRMVSMLNPIFITLEFIFLNRSLKLGFPTILFN